MKSTKLDYLNGFGNYVSTEAIPGALPKSQNNPQKCSFGLYAEQISGTAFTVPRHSNKFTWFYRQRPAVSHFRNLRLRKDITWVKKSPEKASVPNICGLPLRWSPLSSPEKNCDFIDGAVSFCRAGKPTDNTGCHIYLYAFSESMKRTFTNRDGDMLIVPQTGKLYIKTECGQMTVEPTEICVIPRGMAFQVILTGDKEAKGYFLELHEGHFELPELGPIGANGLARRNDFQIPTAAFDADTKGDQRHIVKFADNFYESSSEFSIFDVVAWHGTYYPYKYDLKKFGVINSVSFDHPDPSIFTVLTAQSTVTGQAACDFVIFPPRWMVAEHTFRPPWFHRNFMTEFMGLIYGSYDAKEGTQQENGFFPGGASLHQMMTPHGPDSKAFTKGSTEALKPVYYDKGLAFMFETCYPLEVSDFALTAPVRQRNYEDCWKGLDSNFDIIKAAETNRAAMNKNSKSKL